MVALLVLLVGAGFGLTPATNGLTLKSHLQLEIGGRKTD